MHAHVCWVLGAVRSILQRQAVQNVMQTMQACILAACHLHANKVSPCDSCIPAQEGLTASL